MDHRGTPASPGLVATLVSDSDLEAMGERSTGDPSSKTQGVAYLVPDDKAEEVLAGLDFREKGGYTRATVDVFPAGGDGEPKAALLYTATPDNPNFFLSSVEDAADTIASAVGPSGPNSEYLFSLSEYLEKVQRLASYVVPHRRREMRRPVSLLASCWSVSPGRVVGGKRVGRSKTEAGFVQYRLAFSCATSSDRDYPP
ncbi:unnamed protein product [Scytosiphon promiscuus]